jgi:hypothetical protein
MIGLCISGDRIWVEAPVDIKFAVAAQAGIESANTHTLANPTAVSKTRCGIEVPL